MCQIILLWEVFRQNQLSTVNKKNRNIIISFIFTTGLIVLLLANISFKSVLKELSNYSLDLLALIFLTHLTAYIARTWVFYLFFSKKSTVSFLYLLNTHFIHNFYVHIIPASLGEISFPILMRKKMKPEKSISVLVITRLLFLLLTVLLFIVSIFLNFDFFSYYKIESDKLYFVFIGLIPLLVIVFYRKSILNFIGKIKILKKLKSLLSKYWKDIKYDFAFLKNSKKFLFFIFLLTMINIVALVATYFLILKGMNLELTFFQIVFVSSIGIAFILLPIKSIGGFGTTEGAWAIGMLVLGFDKEVAIQSGFVVHIVALLNVLIMFIFGLIFRSLYIKKIP